MSVVKQIYLKKTILLLIIILLLTGCSKKMREDDIRNVLPDIEPVSVSETDNKVSILYDKDTLTTTLLNFYISTLTKEYDYEITKEATSEGEDTVFELSKKEKEKNYIIEFTIDSSGKTFVVYKEREEK